MQSACHGVDRSRPAAYECAAFPSCQRSRRVAPRDPRSSVTATRTTATRNVGFSNGGLRRELDYLIREFLGVDAELGFLDGLVYGAMTLEHTTRTDIERSRDLIATYRSLDIGLVDSAVIATAERLGIRRVLTVHERDFRAVKAKGGPLTLLPSDEA